MKINSQFLTEYKIADLGTKWPDKLRHEWPDENAMGGLFGAFFASNTLISILFLIFKIKMINEPINVVRKIYKKTSIRVR